MYIQYTYISSTNLRTRSILSELPIDLWNPAESCGIRRGVVMIQVDEETQTNNSDILWMPVDNVIFVANK